MNSLKWHNVGALISFSTDKLSRLNTHNWVKNLWTWMLAPRLTIERTLHIMQSVTLRKWAFLCSKTVCVMSTNFCNPSFMMWYWGSLVMNQLHFEVYRTPRAINLPSLPLIRYQQNKTGKQSTGIGLKESSIVLFSNEWHWNQANIAFYYSRIL